MTRFRGGFFTIFRDDFDLFKYAGSQAFHLWGWLKRNAAFKPSVLERGGVRYNIEPGMIVTGIDEIAKDIRIHRSKVWRLIKKLEVIGLISVKSDTRGTIIKLLEMQGNPDNNFDERDTGETPVRYERDTVETVVLSDNGIMDILHKGEEHFSSRAEESDQRERDVKQQTERQAEDIALSPNAANTQPPSQPPSPASSPLKTKSDCAADAARHGPPAIPKLAPDGLPVIPNRKFTPDEMRYVRTQWLRTLKYYRAERPISPREEYQLAAALQRYEPELIGLAFYGACHEPKSDRFNRANFLSLQSIIGPDKIERLAGIGAARRNAEEARNGLGGASEPEEGL